MPSRNEIQQEITSPRQDLIRRKYLTELHDLTKRNTILYATAFTSKSVSLKQVPSLLLSVTNEDIQGFMAAVHGLSGDQLDLIIHSPGGSSEAAEQIVTYLRKKFNHIRAIIPQNAMSAGTMIACACDEIVLAKHSAMGPIDPQMSVNTASGRYFIPAQSILDEFEQAKSEISTNPALATLWVNRINQYPHGFLNQCKNLIDQSPKIVGNWLQSYMFKDSAEKDKGQKIADWLGNATHHKSHGRPLMIDELLTQGLKVTELEKDSDLQNLVLSVFHATMVTFDTSQCVKMIENHSGKGWFSNISTQ